MRWLGTVITGDCSGDDPVIWIRVLKPINFWGKSLDALAKKSPALKFRWIQTIEIGFFSSGTFEVSTRTPFQTTFVNKSLLKLFHQIPFLFDI